MAKYILYQEQINSLKIYVEEKIGPMLKCSGYLKHTEEWIKDNIPAEQHDAVLDEIISNGGYCDCEMLLNCYLD